MVLTDKKKNYYLNKFFPNLSEFEHIFSSFTLLLEAKFMGYQSAWKQNQKQNEPILEQLIRVILAE